MRKFGKLAFAAIIAGALGCFEMPVLGLSGLGGSIGVSQANAQDYAQGRRVARRTARRTSARVNYRQSVAGCSPYNVYWNCGGVYYGPVVQDGVTVYVVVTP